MFDQLSERHNLAKLPHKMSHCSLRLLFSANDHLLWTARGTGNTEGTVPALRKVAV